MCFKLQWLSVTQQNLITVVPSSTSEEETRISTVGKTDQFWPTPVWWIKLNWKMTHVKVISNFIGKKMIKSFFFWFSDWLALNNYNNYNKYLSSGVIPTRILLVINKNKFVRNSSLRNRTEILQKKLEIKVYCYLSRIRNEYHSRRLGLIPFLPITGTRRGDFCYHLNGEIGEVDDFLEDVPINVECDPRLSCANSITKNQCEKVPGMNLITVSYFAIINE